MAVSFGGRFADATAPVAGMAGCRRAWWKTVSSVLQEELRLKPLLQEVHGNREASERVVEADLALHADLVRRYAPLEEVGQLLHVLQLHERERVRSEEHTSEIQSLMRISYAVFCLKKKHNTHTQSSKTN